MMAKRRRRSDRSAEERKDKKGIHWFLLNELHRVFVLGLGPGTFAWRLSAAINGHLRGGERSANYGRMARAVHANQAAEARLGREQLNARQWWDELERRETHGDLGHRYQEYGGQYSSWMTLAEAATVVALNDSNCAAARMLIRECLCWCVTAREILHTTEGKNGRETLRYRGYGSRRAGLRKQPWSWDCNPDDLFFSLLLGLPVDDRLPSKKKEVQLARVLAPKVREILARSGHGHLALLALRALVLGETLVGDRDRLREIAAPLRSGGGMRYVAARSRSGDTWSHLEGRRYGNNTACTWSHHGTGMIFREGAYGYSWKTTDKKGNEVPDPRVRKGALVKAGPEIGSVDAGGHYRVRVNGTETVVMKIPAWLAAGDTLYLEIFPDRPPVLRFPEAG